MPRFDTVNRYLHTGPVGMRFQFGIEPSLPVCTRSEVTCLTEFFVESLPRSGPRPGLPDLGPPCFPSNEYQGLSDPGAAGVVSSDASAVPAPD